MILLRTGLSAAILLLGTGAVMAGDGAAPCDAICELQAYLARDHMVAPAPIPEMPATAAKPHARTRAAQAKPVRAAAAVQPKARPAVEARAAPRPQAPKGEMVRRPVRARVIEARNVPLIAPSLPPAVSPAPAGRRALPIPGSAPTMSAGFVPAPPRGG